jgi:hypothetical protein
MESSGRLLQADEPAMALDSQFKALVFGASGINSSADSSAGLVVGSELWSSSTVVNGNLRFDHVLAATIQQPYKLTPAELDGTARGRVFGRTGEKADSVDVPRVIFDNAQTNGSDGLVVQAFDADTPYVVKACGRSDFQVLHTSPRLSNGWYAASASSIHLHPLYNICILYVLLV